jgi:F-type H+-transporting ATPase subunit alpha
VRGYLDKVAANDVVRFEQGLLTLIRSQGADILASIRDKREITADTEEKLKTVVESYVKSFA